MHAHNHTLPNNSAEFAAYLKCTGMGEEDLEDDSVNSHDEALCEVLGLSSLDMDLSVEDSESDYSNRSLNDLLAITDSEISVLAQRHGLKEQYESQSYCIFPRQLSVPPCILRRITDELIWGGEKVQADRSYEIILLRKDGELFERRTLTRFENFVNHQVEWDSLSRGYIARLISVTLQKPQVLFKEKLNLKPPGGTGFAPHLDGPSLRVALGPNGPRTFLTVMIAIDDMTIKNGCLKFAKGSWNEVNACPTEAPEEEGNPDAGGRAGAIPHEIADAMEFDDVAVPAGSVVAFSAWMPHRSSPNQSHFPRRAVFLTYNSQEEGDYHNQYYDIMKQLRDKWRHRSGLDRLDRERELEALASIPQI